MRKRALFILGAGSFAIEALEIAMLDGAFDPIGFVVSEPLQPPATHAGLPVYHEDALPPEASGAEFIGGIVTTRRQAFVERLLKRGCVFATLRHPSAILSPRAEFGAGSLVGAGTIVASNTIVGAHVLINRGANIGHDNRLGAFATVGPGATLAGGIDVGEGAYIGVGAVVRDHVTIGAGSVVAAGAVVVKSVDPHVLVAGCPARVVKRDVDGL